LASHSAVALVRSSASARSSAASRSAGVGRADGRVASCFLFGAATFSSLGVGWLEKQPADDLGDPHLDPPPQAGEVEDRRASAAEAWLARSSKRLNSLEKARRARSSLTFLQEIDMAPRG